MILSLISSTVLWSSSGGTTYSSGSASMLVGNSGQTHWDARYSKLNGFRQRKVSLYEGLHIFTVEMLTNSGEISLSIKGKSGTDYYSGSAIPTSTFSIVVDGNDKVTIRVDAKNHSGSYKISWAE